MIRWMISSLRSELYRIKTHGSETARVSQVVWSVWGEHLGTEIPGYWPCAFHIHPAVEFKGENATTGSADQKNIGEDEGCYLWRV